MTAAESKIVSYTGAKALAAALRTACFRLVITNGCFDLLHAGHIRYLEAAAALGDHLMVGVNADWAVTALKGPNRPLNTAEDRMYVLAGLGCVKSVVQVDNVRVDEFIRDMRAAVWVKGGDYTYDTLDQGEKDAASASETKVEIIPVTRHISTTAILSRKAA